MSETAMSAYELLDEFLGKYAIRNNEDKDKYTHTNVAIRVMHTGKFNIPDNKMGKFLKIYTEACKEGPLTLSERQKNVGPMMCDIDLEFDETHTKREYTEETIRECVELMNDTIYEILDIEQEDIVAYVMEKPKPTIEKMKNDKTKIKKIKDGIHMCYVIPLQVSQRFTLYEIFKKKLCKSDIMKQLPIKNKMEDILDISTVYRNNWMMYGSRKEIVQPYQEPYKLTHIYDYDVTERNVAEYTDSDLITLFSVRQFGSDRLISTREEYVKMESEIVSKYLPRTDTTKVNSVTTERTQERKETTRRPAKARDIEDAIAFCRMLSAERAEGYNDWMCVCWALHSVTDDPKLLEAFIEFSKKSKSKFELDKCNKVWNTSKVIENGLTIKSLKWWAYQDNPIEYQNYVWSQCVPRLKDICSSNHVDLSGVAKDLFGHKFKCSNISKHIDSWYEFNGIRWVKMDSATTLRDKLSTELVQRYLELGATAMKGLQADVLKDVDASIEFEVMRNKTGQYMKIAQSLRTASYLDTLVKECSHKFYDADFKKKMNSKTTLICFKNGVYDLSTGIFRNGSPDDYITMDVGYDYEEISEDDKRIKDINEFMEKIMVDEDTREFLLKYISSLAEGGNPEQKFVLFTGKGCHAPDTEILMYDGSIKYAKDVRIGELLMGDDSKQRRVEELYVGSQEMYKVTLSDGSHYKCNADHRLAIKLCREGTITGNEDKIIVSYYKYKDGIPIEIVKEFGSEELVSATKYLQKKREKKSYIGTNRIIPIKIIDFIKLPENIRKICKNFRNKIEFNPKQTVVDAYKVGTKMGTTCIPTDYKINSVGIREKLLSGIMDKHGEIDGDNVYIRTENLIFKKDCIFLCRSLGYDVIDVGARIEVMGNFKNLYLEKIKPILTEQNKKVMLTYDISIESIGYGEYYGFRIDGNERYILENCVVTYNSNGKSILIDLIKDTYGDYYKPMSPLVLTTQRKSSSNATPELADKQGIRTICMSEPEETDKIYSSQMKIFTSNTDEIVARGLYETETTFVPQFKLIMVCNNKPDIMGKDFGTWRRILVVLFKSLFVDKASTKEEYQFQKDPYLGDRIKTENWKVAFSWMLLNKYYPKYKEEQKNGGLKLSQSVIDETSSYKFENDCFLEHISLTYEITTSKADTITIAEFYMTFKEWYKSSYGGNAQDRKIVVNYIKNCTIGIKIEGNNIIFLKRKKSSDED